MMKPEQHNSCPVGAIVRLLHFMIQLTANPSTPPGYDVYVEKKRREEKRAERKAASGKAD